MATATPRRSSSRSSRDTTSGTPPLRALRLKSDPMLRPLLMAAAPMAGEAIQAPVGVGVDVDVDVACRVDAVSTVGTNGYVRSTRSCFLASAHSTEQEYTRLLYC